jgi:four helix bundle protein
MDLAVEAHRAADALPFNERFGLAAQIKRSATSVPSNIAEGHAQRGDRAFLYFLRIALGSLAELDTQLELAVRLKHLEEDLAAALQLQIAQTGRLLHGLRRALWASTARTVVRGLVVLLSAGGALWMFR